MISSAEVKSLMFIGCLLRHTRCRRLQKHLGLREVTGGPGEGSREAGAQEVKKGSGDSSECSLRHDMWLGCRG